MTKWVRALVTFVGDSNLVPRAHVRNFITTCDSNFKGSYTLFLIPQKPVFTYS